MLFKPIELYFWGIYDVINQMPDAKYNHEWTGGKIYEKITCIRKMCMNSCVVTAFVVCWRMVLKMILKWYEK